MAEDEKAPARTRRTHARRGASESTRAEKRIAVAFVAVVVICAVAVVAVMTGVVDLARPSRLAFITPGQRVAAATFANPKF